MAFTFTASFKKNTTNKAVYDHPDIGSFYLPKGKIQELGNPSSVTITVESTDKEG